MGLQSVPGSLRSRPPLDPLPLAGGGAMNPVAWFADVGIADRPTVGGKGGSLGELTQAGIAVPPGSWSPLPRSSSSSRGSKRRARMRDTGRRRSIPDDLGAATRCPQHLRARVMDEPMPPAVEAALTHGASPSSAPMASRSPCAPPPPPKMPKTRVSPGCRTPSCGCSTPPTWSQKVRECWASLYSVESMTYRRKQQPPRSAAWRWRWWCSGWSMPNARA